MRTVFIPFKLYVVLLISLFTAGCQNSTPQDTAPAAALSEMRQVTLSAILQHPQKFLSQNVTLEGVFAGWSGGCRGVPPKTRSDWMFKQKDYCIYVSGSMPKGTSAQPPEKGIGKVVHIQGIVQIDVHNRPYIELK